MTTINTSNPGYRIAIDVGGTFVDFVMLNETTGEITLEKQPSTPSQIVKEVSAGLSRLPVKLAEVGKIFHGTTVAINTIVQETGVKVGLLTTLGFRDVLEIGRGSRPEIYNPRYRAPECLVPRYLRREIPGRLSALGEEITALDLNRLDKEVDYLLEQGCEAIAICFLNSYANNRHEALAAQRLRGNHPGLALAVSHELANEWREFERTSTTVLNAYVQPPFAHYIETLTARLRDDGYASPLALMQSNGGAAAASRAASTPIKTLESGPAGGVIGASAVAKAIKIKNLICFDVGGTTVDVALIEEGHIVERSHTQVSGRPVMGPTIDISSVGAGGGSIAWINQMGALQVGPKSAGASPGPACFGNGGTEPTVTDCHLLLGHLDADRFLGSRMKLDVEAATDALSKVARPFELSIEQAASGALKIAETNMANAVRSITVERGLDPRDYALFSYGGGGGLFAAAVSDELGVDTVIVPRAPANFSAWGIVASDYREDSSHTLVRPFVADTINEIMQTIERLKSDNMERLGQHGFGDDKIQSKAIAEVRFAGQEYTVAVPVETSWLDAPDTFLNQVRTRFVELHCRMYGHGDIKAPLELVTLRLRSIGEVASPPLPDWPAGNFVEPHSWRNTFFSANDGFTRTPVYNRDDLVRNQCLDGPAIIEEWTTTTLIPPGWRSAVDGMGNLILTKNS